MLTIPLQSTKNYIPQFWFERRAKITPQVSVTWSRLEEREQT